MIVVPFIIGLLAFVYIRPQEFYEPLHAVPWLYLLTALSLFGVAVGVRLRLCRAWPVPQLWWALLLLLWTILSVAINVPGSRAIGHVTLVATAFCLFLVIAQGVQSFRDLAAVSLAIVLLGVFLSAIGIHQGLAPTGCIELDQANFNMVRSGTFDGRRCQVVEECEAGPGSKPGSFYACEHVGLFGTTSVDRRVRYRGVLQDPNELAMAITACVPLLFALAARRRSPIRWAAAAAAFSVAMVCLIFTESRSGQLAFGAALAVYFVYRFRGRGLLVCAALAMPLVLLGGRSGGSAEESVDSRFESWREALLYVRDAPILGIGQGMFVERHFLTAHNSYLLAASELGLVGFFLWSALIYTSLKILVCALRRLRSEPGAGTARAWALALLASMAGVLVSMAFLSLSYHLIVWIYFGLCGAYYSALKRHEPDFVIGFGMKDALAVLAADAGMLIGAELLLRFEGY